METTIGIICVSLPILIVSYMMGRDVGWRIVIQLYSACTLILMFVFGMQLLGVW